MENTNEKLKIQRERLGENTNKHSYKDMDRTELDALLGLFSTLFDYEVEQ